MSDLSRFFKHSSVYTIGNIINRIGAFLLLPIYTNYLTVEEYGTLELFYVAMAVISGVLGVGMAHATLRFFFDHKSQDERHAAVSTNFIGSFFITLFSVLLLSIYTEEMAFSIFESDRYTLGLYAIYATLVFELSSQICLAYIRAIEYSMFFVIISFVKLVVQVTLNSYLIIVEDAGVIGVLFGNLATVFIGWLALAYFTLKRCHFHFHWDKFYPVLKYCFPFLLSTIVGLVSTNADKFILNYIISLEAVGLFALAIKFSMIIDQLIGEPFSRSYGAFRYTVMDNPNAAELQSSIVKYLLILSAFVALSLSFFAPDVLRLMSDESFWPAADLVPLIMISSVIRLLSYPAQTGILVAKKPKYLFYFKTISALVSAGGNFALINYIGLEGACVSLILTEAVILYFTHTYSQKFFKVDYEYAQFVKIITLSIVLYMPILLMDNISFMMLFWVKSLLILIFLRLVLTNFVLSSHEIQNLKKIFKDKFSMRII